MKDNTIKNIVENTQKEKSAKDMIIIKNLSKTFHKNIVLQNINLSIKRQELLVVIGASGSGKSVFLSCIIGLMLPDLQSSIIIDNIECSQIFISKRFKHNTKLGVAFQSNALFDSLNIWQNITFELTQYSNITKEEAKKIAAEKLQMVELNTNIMELYPSEISGGMQKRVAIARAIANNPDLLFFDEPTSGLDPITSKKISTLIKDICSKIKATAIVITHDIKCMNIVADNVAAIDNHTIIWHGNVKEIYNSNNSYVAEFINKR